MSEKFTREEYIRKLKVIKNNLIEIMDLSDKREKLRYEYYKKFGEKAKEYISDNPYLSLEDYTLPRILSKPVRGDYPEEPQKVELVDDVSIPEFKHNYIRYILVFLSSLVFIGTLFAYIVSAVSTAYMNSHNESTITSYSNDVMSENMVFIGISFLVNIIFQYIFDRKKDLFDNLNKKIQFIFVGIYLLSFFALFSFGFTMATDNVFGIFLAIAIPFAFISVFVSYKLNKKSYIKDNEYLFNENLEIKDYNKKANSYNEGHQERIDNWKKACKEIDDSYSEKLNAYNKSVENYKNQKSQFIKEIEKRNNEIKINIKNKLQTYKKYYENELKKDVDNCDKRLNTLFNNIKKEIEGDWLPNDYQDLNHINSLLKYFENRSADTIKEASMQIMNKERTQLIADKIEKSTEIIIEKLNNLESTISDDFSLLNAHAEEMISNQYIINENIERVNKRLSLMSEGQSLMYDVLSVIRATGLESLTETKAINYTLGGINAGIGILNYQAHSINNNIRKGNEYYKKIYDSFYGR